MDKYHASKRKACALVGLSRTAWRYQPMARDDESPFRAEIIRLACTYGRYGYRMITGLMRNAGWQLATQERVRRIWQEEGLKVPDKQHPRGRLWLNDGSCLRLRPEYRNHVWSDDFVLVRDVYGRKIRSDNGPEFIANRLRDWLAHSGVKTEKTPSNVSAYNDRLSAGPRLPLSFRTCAAWFIPATSCSV